MANEKEKKPLTQEEVDQLVQETQDIVENLEFFESLLKMNPEEQKKIINDLKLQVEMLETREKLQAMPEAEQAEARKKIEDEIKELDQEALAAERRGIAIRLQEFVEASIDRREAEAAEFKKITQTNHVDLIHSFQGALKEKNKARCGALLRKLAIHRYFDSVLNFYGFPSSLQGMHDFFNQIMVGQKQKRNTQGFRVWKINPYTEKPEADFEQFKGDIEPLGLTEEEAYHLENDISLLNVQANQIELSYAMVAELAAYRQMSEAEHLAAALSQIIKLHPKDAARMFGLGSYGSVTPREKGNFEVKGDSRLERLGLAICLLLGSKLVEYIEAGEMNPEAVDILVANIDLLRDSGVDKNFIKALSAQAKKKIEQTELSQKVMTIFEADY